MSLTDAERESLACACGHEAQWHGELGCGYLGWNYGKPKCGCVLTAQQAVEAIVQQRVEAFRAAAVAAIVQARPLVRNRIDAAQVVASVPTDSAQRPSP